MPIIGSLGGGSAGGYGQRKGGAAPSAGNVTSNDVYTYTAIKTAGSTFTVLAAQTQFA